jgi:Zn-dependent alcohol dehydrogenase
MRAAVLTQFGAPLAVRDDVEIADPGPGEVMVRVAAAGICGSDLKALDGKSPVTPHLPLIPGHESAGVVEKVGEGVSSVRPGDHAIVAMTGPCGRCAHCRAGRFGRCDGPTRASIMGLMTDGTTRLKVGGEVARPFIGVGGFAEFVVVNEQMVVKIAKEAPLENACLLACGVITGVGAVVNSAKVEPGSTVAVVGCGGVGLNVVQGARLAGAATIVAVDIAPDKVDLARTFGATNVVVADDGDLTSAILSVVPAGVDYAFDVTGVPGVLTQAFNSTRDGGTTVMVGSPPSAAALEISPQKLFFSRTLRGCTGGDGVPARDLPMLVDLCMNGRLLLDELVSERVPLEDINGAIERVRAGKVARVVVTF